MSHKSNKRQSAGVARTSAKKIPANDSQIKPIMHQPLPQPPNSPESFEYETQAPNSLLNDVWSISDEQLRDLMKDIREITNAVKSLPEEFSIAEIAQKLTNNRCSLKSVMCMGNPDVLQTMLEVRAEAISKEESYNLMYIAMRLPHLANIRVLVRYGAGTEERREAFTKLMFQLLNESDVDVNCVKKFLHRLHNVRVIDQFTVQFLKDTFEKGKARVIQMLLDSEIYAYVRDQMGDDLVARLFGNVNVDTAEVLHGRGFNENAKCDGKSALHYAAMSLLVDNVQFLLECGANPQT